MIKRVHFENRKEIPLGIKIISILHYIFAGMFAFLGISMIFTANKIVDLLVNTTPELAQVLTSGLMIGVGVFLLALGIFALLVGMYLWKLRKWARIVAIIFAMLWFINLVYGMITAFAFMQIIFLLISVFIWGYLIFSKDARKSFK